MRRLAGKQPIWLMPLLTLLMVFSSVPAQATCWPSVDERGRKLKCCSAPDGETRCTLSDADSRSGESDKAPEWGELKPGFGLSFSAGPTFYFAYDSGDEEGTDLSPGLEVSLGFLHHRNVVSGESVGGKLASGMLSLFLGNQWGLEVRGRSGFQRRTIDETSSVALSMDLVPVTYYAIEDTSFRLHSVLGAMLPTVGLEWMGERPFALRVKILRPSFGWVFTDWMLMEFGAGLLWRFELQETDEPPIGDFGLDSFLRVVILL